ncbi:hypothetical protein EII14_05530 [Alloprevotella sp. OH1205_COT-284]|nr:hypothetical protein EII14_05530 [Alloprevotella sp. OH1205_COT-284]
MYLLSSAYLAPIHYYTKLIGDRPVVEERCEHYVKQTYRNRCLIATPDGILPLTIPVEGRPKSEGGTSKTPMRDIRISQHGRWRDLHWNALVSAYENSPFFQYYADDFWEIYRRPHAFLVDFNEALQHLVLDLLNYRPSLSVNLDGYIDARALGDSVADFRETIHPKRSFAFDPSFRIIPYYQVFAARTGFLPNLSVVDLLFNMGSESRIVLRQSLVASVSSSAPAVVER